MAKETKIGLAVVGGLLLVFGALLVRKWTASSAPEQPVAAADAKLPSSAGMADKPVVLAHKNGPEHTDGGAGRDQWSKSGRGHDFGSESGVEGPRRNFMPAEHQAGAEPPRDRYAAEAEPVAQQDAAAERPVGGSPFRRAAAAASSDEEPRQVADEPTEQPLRNPIRRLSAQEPLGVEDADAPAGVVDDRYASETPADDGGTEPSVRSELPDAPGTLDAPEPVREAPEPATEPRWQSGGTAVRPVAGINESAVDSGKYTVQPNDNLWTISEKVYGTGGYFKALYEHNRAVLPRADRLAVGTVIAVPPTGVLEQNFPTLCPKQRKSAVVKARTMPASTRGRRASGDNVYVVEEGDTLFDIARYELGKASRWAEIYDLNRDVLGEDFDYLRPGIELQMPPRSQQAPDSVTRQGDSRYQR